MHSASALIAVADTCNQEYPGRESRPNRGQDNESLTLGGDFRNVALGDMSNILLRFRTQSLDEIVEQSAICYNDIIKHPDSNLLEKLHFLTINPSPEFMYLQYKNFMDPADYKSQLVFFEKLLIFIAQETNTKILSISAESGKGKGLKPYLHYHCILIQSSKRNYKRFYNALRNQVTVLHTVKGFQTALRESEVQAQNVKEGIEYFSGVQPHTKNKRLKPDYYSSFPYSGI
ncbi:MAG: putative replicase [Circular genetic element sp.]|nr:MAG: putative replicase [Circular genetic element sp.]